MISFRQVSAIMVAPQPGPISLKTLALHHRWEAGSIGTGYSRITDRYSIAELIKMSGKATYSQALDYFDLNPVEKTTNPFPISLKAILSRHKINGENRFRFLTYNTYLLKVKFGLTLKEKPLIDERSSKIGQDVRDNIDVACLYEIFTDDVWEIVKNSWPAGVQYNRGKTDSDVICIVQKGSIVERCFQAFDNKGIVTDSDWLSNKGILFTKVDTGFGLIEIFCTHLFFGGGLPVVEGSSPTERTKVKIAETKQLLAFYHVHHKVQNVALIVGDFNIDANANLNRPPYINSPFSPSPYSVDEYNREYKALKALMYEHNFYDLWVWDIYKRQPNTGYTTRYTDDDDDLDKDFATCRSMSGDYCDDSRIDEPKRHNLGEGRLDYVFIQKPEKDHTFNLDVTIPKRKAFKQRTQKGDEYENFLSDHLGLSFDIIVSPK
ncbi:MAG: hypothetical protein EOP45_05825 [Sphingobacteriaceae bacterium]|nr:MAG: hypothetical protein EOP45_05825 [Sphingobacteriaceae bacterium]